MVFQWHTLLLQPQCFAAFACCGTRGAAAVAAADGVASEAVVAVVGSVAAAASAGDAPRRSAVEVAAGTADVAGDGVMVQ